MNRSTRPLLDWSRRTCVALGVMCAALAVTGVAPAWATSYFNQPFTSGTSVSTYTTGAANMFNDAAGSGAGVVSITTSGGNNSLRVNRTGGGSAWYTRTADLSPAPSAMVFKFNLTVTGNTGTPGTIPNTLRIGTGFSAGTGEPSNTITYATLGIMEDNTSGGFKIRDVAAGATLATLYTGTQLITWVLNNSGAGLSYQGPDSTTQTIANDKMDVWVGTNNVLNDVNVTTAGLAGMTDFKWWSTSNMGPANYDFDNFDLQSLPPTLSLTQTAATCANNDGTVTATFANGTAPYQVKIDGGALAAQTSPFTFTGLAQGTHLVTVQDNTGAQTFKTIVVSGPTPINLALTQTPTSCNGLSDGSITANWSTGVAPFLIKIDGGLFASGATSPTQFTGLTPGSHSVTVQDANGCTATQSITVVNAPALVLSLAGRNPCFGVANGSVVATFSGGTGTLQTQIDNGGYAAGSPRTFTNLGPGLHTVDLKDANGCTTSQQVTLTENPEIFLSLIKADATCPTGNTGRIIASFSGGTGTIQSSIDNGTFTTVATPRTFNNLSPGSHTVTVRDANPNNNCSVSATIIIGAPVAPSFSLTSTNPTCNGLNDGKITATFSGANGPYQLRIDSGTFTTQTSPFTFTGVSGASHTIQLRDDSLCVFSQTTAPVAPSDISLLIGKSDASCFNAADGSVIATYSGGTGALASSLDGGPFTFTGSAHTYNNLLPGSHYVTIRDGNGCRDSSFITIGSSPTINLSLTKADVNCVGASNGSVTATFSGGVPTLATLFSQDFAGTNPPVSDFVSGTPNSGQWNSITGTTAGNVTTSSNYLQFIRSGGTYSWARTANFSPTPTAMIMKFDYTLQAASASGSTSEVFRVGSGFGTGNADDATTAQTYARFYIGHDNSPFTFTIADANGNVASGPYPGAQTQTITWVLNNTGSQLTYIDPNGDVATLDNDLQDVWVGVDPVIDDGGIVTTSQAMNNMKWAWVSNSGTVRFDNFLIQTPNGPLFSNIDGGAFTPVASPRTFTGLAPGSHPVIVKDVLGCQISQSISVGTTPTVFHVAASAGAGGTITPSGSVAVNCGENSSFSIVADNCAAIADVLVDGVSVGAVASYTFTNVQANHTIAASFTSGSTTILASAGTGGSISPSGTVNPACGADQAFTITPDACYTIADVVVDGGSVGAVSSYTFTGLAGSHTITASFAINAPSSILSTAGPNGTISPLGSTSVACGADQAYQITPDACFAVADVMVDGASVGAVTGYTFTNVQTAHTIDATFAAVGPRTITASAGVGGQISPSGPIALACGSDQAFAITTDACYSIADVKVDGSSVGAVAGYTFTNVQVDHTIEASFAIATYPIAASAGTGGTITPSGSVVVNCGSDQAFAIAASACYTLADVTVDGSSVGAVSGYTFTNVQTTHTIAATFAATQYTIDASAGPGGTIAPSGPVLVDCGTDKVFTIDADDCYSIADVVVDGGSVGAVTSYTFANVQAGHTILATFALIPYTLTATAGPGGSISSPGPTVVNCGGSKDYTITPDACYAIADVKVDGVSQGPAATYTFTNVQASHTIAATFAITTYAIDASAGPGGQISPSSPVSVNCGSDQVFSITADPCYSIADVVADGSSVGAVASYTFANVQSTHTIAATFSLNSFTIDASAGTGGTISPSGLLAVNCGSDQVFAISANDCYSIADVVVDGGSVGAVPGYTFANVQTGHTIAATFSFNGPYTIDASAGTGGTISPSGLVSVVCGTDQTFGITPDDCYSIADVTVDGSSVGAVAGYTFTHVQAGHSIAATFSFNGPYTIDASAGTGGTISPSGLVSVVCGTDQAFSITADDCYSIADVTVDGSSVGAVPGYTFSDVHAGHTIEATFSLNGPYTIDASAGTGGTISPSGLVSVVCGTDQAFAISANDCYTLADVAVDGSSVGAVAGYTFTDVHAGHTIAATFSFNGPYTIEASAGLGGTISPSGLVSVVCGADQTFSITADDCYSIADVTVDGSSVGAVAGYTFTHVQAGHTIAATFSFNGPYTIDASAGTGGTISPSGLVSVVCGTDQTFSITPDDCYSIADVTVDGGSVGAVPGYTFTHVQAGHTIAATFSFNGPYSIETSAGVGGQISPSGPVSVVCGTDQAFGITPDDCYSIADVTVDGSSVGAVAGYTFSDVHAGHTIEATFSLNGPYTIDASAGTGGTITPSGLVSVVCGADQAFAISADDCYTLADVTVDGSSVGAVAGYTFSDVHAGHTIAATFSFNGPYTIDASAGTGGTISPSGLVSVVCGTDQTFSITPDDCYSIADVTVDGGSVGAVAGYTFTHVQAGHTIAATFSFNGPYTIDASAGTGGTISPSGAVSVVCGTDQAFAISADDCYSIADVTVDGSSVGAVPGYTFTHVQAGHTIAATFSFNGPYTIDASAGTGGTISPSGPVSVVCGTDQAFAISANDCYTLADVAVDGSSVGAVAGYTFTDVHAGHTIAATFSFNGPYSIDASAGLGGTISPSGAVSVVCGTDQTFSITADDCYSIADVTVDGGSVGVVAGYTFTNVQAGHTIAATFSFNGPYTIDASAGTGGTISPSGAVSVVCGTDQAFAISADDCYSIADVTVDGSSVGAVPGYTFTHVQAGHTIAATFSFNGPYSIETSAGVGGQISPSGPVSVVCGTDQAFGITPDNCYSIADVVVDGGSVGAVPGYTFSDVHAGHTIEATFSLNSFTIEASAGTGGTISPSGQVSVNCGSDQAFAISANNCYSIADVTVDGSSVGAVAGYTFTSVQAGHTIAATFSFNGPYSIETSAGPGGTISPSGPVSVVCGTDQAFAISGNDCFVVADVTVDGSSVGAVPGYTFTNVQAGHTIAATFATAAGFTITASAGTGGTISPSGAVAVACGADQAFAISADDCYSIADVAVDGGSVGAVSGYTFTSVHANHTIEATFSLNGPYTIDASAGTGGTIAPSGQVSVACGADQAFAISANDCYTLADVTVDGSSVGALAGYTFTDVHAGHTIAATFSFNGPYSIETSAGPGGTISPSGPVSVVCGTDQAFAISGNDCFVVADVTVDGNSVGAVAGYTFTHVQAGHTIAATFAAAAGFSITASAGTGGTISPSGGVAVACGADQAFAISADDCYSIADVAVDGGSVGAVSGYTFTSVHANHTIEATFSLNGPYTIDASAGTGGTITPSGAVSVACGADQAFAISANDCYTLADVSVDGSSVGAVAGYTFTSVHAGHTIEATFNLNGPYTIDASAGPGGTITPSGAVVVACGGTQAFAVSASDCFVIADVTVDGGSVGAVSGYTFTSVHANHTIAATFTAAASYTIAASAGTGGTISPSGTVAVACGGSQAFAISANDCYTIADVVVDGGSVGAVPGYTFTSVHANHTIAATFSLTGYTITASAGAGGTISPSGAVAVSCGSNQAFSITPNSCFAIADVTVDGGSVGAVAGYTFTNVHGDHTIAATFSTTDVTAPQVTVIAPNGGENLVVGSDYKLSWSATDDCGTIATVNLLLSRDGSTWEVIANGVPNTGTYTWMVTGPGTNGTSKDPVYVALFRVTAQDAAGHPGEDTSDGPFSLFDITTPVVITRLETQTVDDGVAVKWELAAGSSFSSIELERADAEVGPWLTIAADRHAEGDLTIAVDRTVAAGRSYWFRLVATDASSQKAVFGPVSGVAGAPKALSLSAVWPNPSRGAMRCEFAVPKEMPVSLVVVDVQGRVMQVLAKGSFSAGRYQVSWDGVTDRGSRAAAGMYFVRFESGSQKFMRKFTLAQ